jgi:hypothetical protein
VETKTALRRFDERRLDHPAFRWNRLNAENVIDPESLERALCEKPVSTFSRRALARFPLERNRSSDKESRHFKMLERILFAKVCQLLRDSL